MKTSLFALFLFFVLSGCSSSSKKQSDASGLVSSNELDSIKNEDFRPDREIPYDGKSDHFNELVNTTDSLAKESAARLPDPKLDILQGVEDPIAKGIALCYQKKFDAAYAIFDAAYSKYKSHPSYWNQLGSCYYVQGNLKMALLFYNKSRGIDDKYAPPVNNLGVLYQKNGKDQKAFLAYKKAAEMNATALTPVFNLAQLYLKYGFVTEANNLYASLLKVNNTDVDVLAGLATAQLFLGKTEKALGIFQTINPSNLWRADISLNYAVALKFMGKNDDAEKVFAKVDSGKLSDLTNYYKKVKKFMEGKE